MRCLLAAAFVALAGPAAAEAIELPVRVADGETWTQTIAKTRIDERDGKTTSMTATTVIKATYQQRGARPPTLAQEFVAFRSDGMPPEVLAEATAMAKLVYPAVLEVDESLRPVRVVNWSKFLASLEAVGRADGMDDKAIDAARAMFVKMDDETAASLFKELALISLGQGIGLEVGGVHSYDDQVPNLLGGPPIRTTGTFRLESFDKASGQAIVTWKQTLDPASAAVSIGATLEAMAAQLPPDRAATAKAEMAGMTFDRNDACRYTIHVPTGLASTTECTVALTTGLPGKTAKRTEQWTITQTLPEKR
jgi:hypothetical protein